MFKFYTVIGTLLLTTQFAQAGITTSAGLVNHIKSLDDEALVKHLRRYPKAMGSCSYSQAISSTACPYRVKTKNNTILCFTNHPTLSVVAAVKGTWASNPGASAFADARLYMNNMRTSVQAFTDARSRALSYIRNTLLSSPSVCNIQITDSQPSVSKSFDNFSLSDVVFSRSINGKKLVCSTSIFNVPKWNAATCSYVTGTTYLDSGTCQSMLNKLSKTSAVGVAAAVNPVSFAPFTAQIAKEYAVSLVSEAVMSSLPEASSKVTLFDAISPEVMAVGELSTAQITAAAADPAQQPVLAQFHRYVTSAALDSAIEIHSEAVAIKNQIAGYAPVLALSASAQVFNASSITAAKASALQTADIGVLSNITASGATAPTNVFNLAIACPSQMMMEASQNTSSF